MINGGEGGKEETFVHMCVCVCVGHPNGPTGTLSLHKAPELEVMAAP